MKIKLIVACLLCTVVGLMAGEALPYKPASGGQVISLDGTNWLLAIDKKNVGLSEQWWTRPVPDAKPVSVPWVIEDAPWLVEDTASGGAWHGGVAWYWYEVPVPTNPHKDGRFLLRFWNVCYKADVWVNDVPVGGHEGADGMFILDITKSIKENSTNRIAVRVMVPTADGIAQGQVPGGDVFRERGGIIDSVDLLLTPSVRLEDLFVRPDAKTGIIHIEANIRNTGKAVDGHFSFLVTAAKEGEPLGTVEFDRNLPVGDTLITSDLKVAQPRLWQPNDPSLYRVSARIVPQGGGSFDERSVECGFRDFRVENGYFRLNGKRLFLRGTHTGDDCPLGGQIPYKDENWLRRDLINLKAMGFNMVRMFQHAPLRYELDLCDEIGLLVYEEPRGGWLYQNSSHMEERYDRSLTELIRRDRNHASIVMWGLLNETPNPGTPGNDAIFPKVVKKLPLVRSLDNSRLVMLSSGRWDCQLDIGSVSNPGSEQWQCLLGKEGSGMVGKMSSTDIPSTNGWLTAYVDGTGDAHIYPRVPHDARTVDFMRNVGQGGKGIFVSEYGIGSAVDLTMVTRNFEQRGAASSAEAKTYHDRLDKFMAECWEKWKLADTFGRPEDYFKICVSKMAKLRLLGLNILRSNPNVIGYSITGAVDQGMAGEGVSASTFRELKPGAVDALSDGWAPLRWCLFAEPFNLYKGGKIRLEAVLANEDVLAAGDYPVRLQIFGPNEDCVFERKVTLTISDSNGISEPRFSLPVFSEEVTANWPAGKYRFIATFEHGAAAMGGAAEFDVTDPAEMPNVKTDIALWGDNSGLAKWLASQGIHTHPFVSGSNKREVILVSSKPASPGDAGAFSQLAEQIARGSTAIFLSPEVFIKGDQPLGWLPMAKKGKLQISWDWEYLKDEWAKKHPIFDGLPCGGLMDYDFYRNIIPDKLYYGQDDPVEAVSGAAEVSYSYASGLMVAVHSFGAGSYILNTLKIEENLDKDPVAARLLRNMIRYASRDNNKPLEALPVDFNTQLKSIGYLP